MKRLTKPTMRSEWRGQKGNKFRIYIVRNEGKDYVHGENKQSALLQYNSALQMYRIRKQKRNK